MNIIDIRRINSTGAYDFIAHIKPDNNSVQVKKVMGENQINIAFEDANYYNFKINDYCIVFGEKYSMSQLPVVTKISQFLYRYSVTLYADYYDLTKAQFMFLGSDNSLRESEFSLMGTASDFIDLIIKNSERLGNPFVKGEVISTGFKNMTFSKENCYNALVRISEEFNSEFSFEGRIIHFAKKVKDIGHVYKHGRNKGLYEITRQTLNNSDIVTRLYAYGSDKNLPPAYITTGKRLRLPGGYNPCLISNLTNTWEDYGGTVPGHQRFIFSWTDPISAGATEIYIEYRIEGSGGAWLVDPDFINITPRYLVIPNGTYEFRFRTIGTTCSGINSVTDPVVITGATTTPILVHVPLPFIERNMKIYGVIEATEIFDEIYPHRTGTVSAVNLTDVYEFTDAAIDFDVNAYLLPGLTPKVTFNTGQLSGYTFDVQSYDDTFKRFRIQKNGDEKVLDIPSALFKPAIGDQYVITDIEMPTSYVIKAEQDLQKAANAKLIEFSEPQLQYNVTLDPAFVKRVGRNPRIGDLVWIVDAELEVQKKIRITSVTRNIVEDYQYTIELSDLVSPSTIQRIISSTDSNDRNLKDLASSLANNSILNNKVIGTLIFSNMPTTTTMTGFDQVVIEATTGKLHKKI